MAPWLQKIRRFARQAFQGFVVLYQFRRYPFALLRADVRLARRSRNLALESKQQGRPEQAVQLLNVAIETFTSRGLLMKAVDCYEDLCDVYLLLGQQQEAMSVYRAAIRCVEGGSPTWTIAYCYDTLASMADWLELPTEAEHFIRLERGVFEDLGEEDLPAIADLAMAKHLLRSGKPHQAYPLVRSAAQVFYRDKDRRYLADCLDVSAEISCHIDAYDDAKEMLSTLKTLLKSVGEHRVATQAEAKFAVKFGKYEEAIASYHKLLKMVGDDNSIRWHYLYALAILFRITGQDDEAFQCIWKAIEILESIRGVLVSEEYRSSFLEEVHDAYEEMIKISVIRKDPWTGLEYLERLKSRILIEMLAARTNKSAGPGSTSQKLSEAGLDATRIIEGFEHCTMGDNTAVICLFPMESDTIMFVVTNEGGTPYIFDTIIDYGLEQLVPLARELSETARHADRDRLRNCLDTVLSELSIQMYDHVKNAVPKSVEKITFVPYSWFHVLPLHAMFREEDGLRVHLLDEYLVYYTPSLKIQGECLLRDRAHGSVAFVASADTRADLPYSVREAEYIAGLYGTTVNRRATREDIVRRSKDASIFHYSGHADGEALILHPAHDHDKEDRYEVAQIFDSLDLPQSWLATLSGCETAKVRLGRTDEYIGMPSAFLHAGAATVTCSLWTVPDFSTTLLMTKMYGLIEDGWGKAESLRQAQRWLKNPKNSAEHLQQVEELFPRLKPVSGKGLPDATRFGRTRLSVEKLLPKDLSHPYYWAGFICTGAP